MMRMPFSKIQVDVRPRRSLRPSHATFRIEALEPRYFLTAEVLSAPSELSTQQNTPDEISLSLLVQPTNDDAPVGNDSPIDDDKLGSPLFDDALMDAPLVDESLLETWDETSDSQLDDAIDELHCVGADVISKSAAEDSACKVDSPDVDPDMDPNSPLLTEIPFQSGENSTMPGFALRPDQSPDGTETGGDSAAIEVQPAENTKTDSGANVKQTLTPGRLENESPSKGDASPRPQISPVPQITITSTESPASRSVETIATKPLRDISEFLTANLGDQGKSANAGAEVSKRVQSTAKAERLSDHDLSDGTAITNGLRSNEHGAANSVGLSRPQIVAAATLMPVMVSRPRQSASNNASVRTAETLRPTRKVSDSNDAESASVKPTMIDVAVKLISFSSPVQTPEDRAQIPKFSYAVLPKTAEVEALAPEQETVARRSNSLLGIAIAGVLGLPHAFIRPWLIRQRERVTFKQSPDLYL